MRSDLKTGDNVKLRHRQTSTSHYRNMLVAAVDAEKGTYTFIRWLTDAKGAIVTIEVPSHGLRKTRQGFTYSVSYGSEEIPFDPDTMPWKMDEDGKRRMREQFGEYSRMLG